MTVRCKIILDIETSFDDTESTPETVLYCLQEDFSEIDHGLDIYTIHSAEIVDDNRILPQGFSCVESSDGKSLYIFHPKGNKLMLEANHEIAPSRKNLIREDIKGDSDVD